MTTVTMDAKAEFRGSSRESLAELRDALTRELRGVSDPSAVGDELFAVASLLDAQPALRRALTDPSRSADDRAELASGLLRGQASAATAAVVAAAVRLSWARVRDLADAVEYVGVWAVVVGAEAARRLDDLEDELFRFSRIVTGDPRLLRALTDPAVPPGPRVELAEQLLSGRSTKTTVRLVSHAVTAPRGRTFEEAVAAYISVAAERKGQLVAVVHTAVPLSSGQKERLAAALGRQYGQAIDLQIVVDPNILGGLRVQIGDELIDGSIAGRLDDARRRFAG